MSDSPERPPGVPQGATIVATDPRGVHVWVTASTAMTKGHKHDELNRNPEATVDAIESPRLIAESPEYEDRIIYVGQDRPALDPALAPARRIVVAAVSSPSAAKFITAYDERRSRLQASIGAVVWSAEGGD